MDWNDFVGWTGFICEATLYNLVEYYMAISHRKIARLRLYLTHKSHNLLMISLNLSFVWQLSPQPLTPFIVPKKKYSNTMAHSMTWTFDYNDSWSLAFSHQ